MLYLDEIQYFTKKQQQSLLETVENGGITLIASTTENPYFYVYNALLSRCSVFEFKPVTPADVAPAVERAFSILSKENGVKIELPDRSKSKICDACGGDVRKAVGICEMCLLSCPAGVDPVVISEDIVDQLTKNSAQRYDRTGDEHYDCISALHKSLRGSDPDAAVHYLSRILLAGDMPSACRRLMCAACEDVGLAYPQIIPIVKSCVDMALQLGMPEARLPLADAAILIALAPKSNSGYTAVAAAQRDIEQGKAGPSRGSCKTSTLTARTLRKRDRATSIPTILKIIGSDSSIFPTRLNMPSTISRATTKTNRRFLKISKNAAGKNKLSKQKKTVT